MQISDGRGRRPSTTVGVRKPELLSFVWYQNIRSGLFGFVTKQRVTDGRTDRQNYDSQDRASMAAPAAKNEYKN